jgi:hypothetical protein
MSGMLSDFWPPGPLRKIERGGARDDLAVAEFFTHGGNFRGEGEGDGLGVACARGPLDIFRGWSLTDRGRS